MTQDAMFKQMSENLQSLYEQFYMEMHRSGLQFELNEVLRTRETQEAYYAQGRLKLSEVNRLRKLAGLWSISDSENSYKVTWTKNSRHFADVNGKSNAFDIRLLKYGKPHWQTKWDGNKNSIPDYIEAARIGNQIGLEAGGLWEKPDYPHFQIRS